MTSYLVWDADPRVFEAFEYLRWYGVCWLAGIVVGYRIMLQIYRSEGVPEEQLDLLTLYVVLGGIVGARLGHVLFYDPVYFWNHPVEVLPFRFDPSFQFTGLAGLASHGGIAGALVALYAYRRKSGSDYLWLLDRLAIGGVALGAFIRLGNFMNSEIVGVPSNLPWAVVFTSVDATPRHPAQLYESAFYLVAVIVLYCMWRSRKFQRASGFIFGLAMTLIFVQRFLVEFVKENQVAFEETMSLNMGQLLSIPLIVVGIVLMWWRLRIAANRTNFSATGIRK